MVYKILPMITNNLQIILNLHKIYRIQFLESTQYLHTMKEELFQ